MRISVHIEADSAEDYRAAVTALQGQILKESLPQLKEVISGVAPIGTPVLEKTIDISMHKPAPVAKAEPPAPAPAAVEAPSEPVEKPAEKPKRAPRKASGNGAKAAPVEPEPGPVPSEPAQDAPASAPGVRQDLLDAAQNYVLQYGYNFASKDIPELFQKRFGPDIRKLSEVPDADLDTAITLVRQALAENPYNRRVLQNAA